MYNLKKCACCEEIKEVSQFTNYKANKDGLFSYCRLCKSTKAKESNQRCTQRIRTYRKQYNKNIPEKVKEKKKIRSKQYYKENKKRYAEYRKQYYKENKLECNRKTSEWYQLNKEALKATRRKWEDNNKAVRREITTRRRSKKLANGIFKVTNKELNKMLNSLCYICKISKCEHIDHIIPISKGGRHSIGNLAPSCSKCNLRKSNKFLIEVKHQPQQVTQHTQSYYLHK